MKTYYDLDYKGKFVRTVQVMIIGAVVLAAMWLYQLTLSESSSLTGEFAFVTIVFAVVGAIQLIYNYRKWKSEEKNNEE